MNKLAARVRELEKAIRKHRKATGHQMCWENDEELWSVLGDKKNYNHKAPGWKIFMTRCAAYRASRQ